MGDGRGEFGQSHLGRKQVRGEDSQTGEREEGGCKEYSGSIDRDFGD